MKCPFCGNSASHVVDSRDTSDFRIRRRRQCEKCRKRFTTYEDVQLEELVVIKKDGRREPFDRNKLFTGVQRACIKLPIPQEKIVMVVDGVEAKMRRHSKPEIPAEKIGELVMEKLQKIDHVAYIRFASVYRSFTDVESFEKALRSLKKGKR